MANRRILLVDDDQDLRVLVESALKMLRLNVDSVGDGFAALEKTNQKKYDLIIMDWHMPGLDGFETAEKIWSSSNFNKETKIIAFTSSDTSEEVARCISHGFCDVLSKSFEISRLQELLASHLPRDSMT